MTRVPFSLFEEGYEDEELYDYDEDPEIDEGIDEEEEL